jgi:hypothetical protein
MLTFDPFRSVTPTPEQHDQLCQIRGAFGGVEQAQEVVGDGTGIVPTCVR